ncbi:hypothetical protein EZV62_002408 [Acer yangbiense]|uniref:RlpA-like protein double-psi beta-barrel domain-containing protein n=1 Tax=Acer yangbiense TaxID=1000413 RepID=A0A5C7IXJ5_9ROSI|nr:hypothetical protein EZV62_002408 [Acer yangbiense]
MFLASFSALAFTIIISYSPFFANALSSCNGACHTLNDCSGQLICINAAVSNQAHLHAKGNPTLSTHATEAKLTNNDFSEGGDGGGPSECDGKYHSNSNPIVALSTGWYNGGSRCGKMIKIRASNGKSVMAAVVDECDSMRGCDKEHAGQPPCKNNIVDGSDAVWTALGLDKDLGVVDVTWSMP